LCWKCPPVIRHEIITKQTQFEVPETGAQRVSGWVLRMCNLKGTQQRAPRIFGLANLTCSCPDTSNRSARSGPFPSSRSWPRFLRNPSLVIRVFETGLRHPERRGLRGSPVPPTPGKPTRRVAAIYSPNCVNLNAKKSWLTAVSSCAADLGLVAHSISEQITTNGH
jgi:hypothetical protein